MCAEAGGHGVGDGTLQTYKEVLLFPGAPCWAGPGDDADDTDPYPLRENELVLEQLVLGTGLLLLMACLLSIDSKLLQGGLAPSTSSGHCSHLSGCV